MKVAVLISTYNGDKFLKKQLDSILSQTYKDIDICIRDDGSKDDTVKIIREYMQEFQNIKFDEGQNVGFLKSFYMLLQNNDEYDYYSFCDQDDVWESIKIESLLSELKKLDNNKPNMAFSDSDYYDEQLNFISSGDKNKTPSFRNSLVECISQGMTMIVNKKLRDIIIEKKVENVVFHDQWTYMIASSMGNIVYVKESLVKYRRLENNVTSEGKGFLEIMKWRIRKLVLDNGFKKFKNQILEFKNLFYNDLSKENQELLNLFTKGYNLKNAIKKFVYPKRFRMKFIDEIMVRILFLFGVL